MKLSIFIVIALPILISKQEKPVPYFQFDQVDYFTRGSIEDTDIFTLSIKSNKTDYEKKLVSILLAGKFSYADTAFLKNANTFGFRKESLSADQVKQLKSIFDSKTLEADFITFCDPVFNDILIFRYKSTITGYAKICVSCGKMELAGQNVNDKFNATEERLEQIKTLLDIK